MTNFIEFIIRDVEYKGGQEPVVLYAIKGLAESYNRRRLDKIDSKVIEYGAED